jgi:hypothetical protein
MYELGLVIRPRSYAALSRGSAQMHAAFGVSEEKFYVGMRASSVMIYGAVDMRWTSFFESLLALE